MIPTQRFNGRVIDKSRLQKILRKDEVRAMHVADGNDHKSKQKLDFLLDSAEEGGEGWAVVITGPSGSGKSHCIDRFCAREDFKQFSTPEADIIPLLYVEAPSPCKLITLGHAIYTKLTGKHLPSGAKLHDVWRKVRKQLKGHQVSILVIDELHHVLQKKSEEDDDVIAETLKSLLIDKDWPMQLVLAGMPELSDYVNRHKQLKRRRKKFQFNPLKSNEKGRGQAQTFVELLEAKLPKGMKFDFPDHDMPGRFLKASRGYTGHIAMFVKLAAFQAISAGKSEITYKHLSQEYEELYECKKDNNPFSCLDLAKCAEPPKDPDRSRLTRIHGALKTEELDA